MIFECTISGEGAIIWRGSAFDCISISNELVLLLNGYHRAVECNNGAVEAQGNNYTSLLIITDSSLSGSNTECIHYNGTNSNVIGNLTIPTIVAATSSGKYY